LAKKNGLKKSDYSTLVKLLFWILFLMIVCVVVVPFTPLIAGAPAWWVTTHGFFVDVRTNIVAYASFLAIMLGLLGVAVYLFKKYIIK